MLVYCKNPRGVIYLNNEPIYGSETGRDPVEISFEVYNSCKDALQDATYRETYLSYLFKRDFPLVAFTYSEVRYLPESKLDEIGPLMMDNYDLEWSHKKKIDQIKIAIRCH